MLKANHEFLLSERQVIFFPNEPQKTQEAICELEGRIDECVGQIGVLTNPDELKEYLSEYERDSATRAEGAGETRPH